MSTISASTTSTTAYKVTADTTGTLVLQTGSTPTTAVTIDTAQNMGLGVTPSAWGSTYRMQQIGLGAAVGGRTAAITQAYLSANWYQDGSGNKYIGSGAASQYQQDAGAHYWFNAASGTAGNAISFTQAMTLDASGNLGVGTTSPSSFVGSGNKLVVGNAATTTTSAGISVYSGTATYGGVYFADGTSGDQAYRGAVEYNHSTDALLMYSAGAERARIDSSGNFMVGVTSSVSSKVRISATSSGSGTPALTFAGAATNNACNIGCETGILTNSYGTITIGTANPGNGYFISFSAPDGGYNYAIRGSIALSGTSVAYNTSSDYRLKKDIQPMTGALAKVLLLKPVTYKWLDDSDGEGFVAHELAEVVPQAVTGEKDAVEIVEVKDDDGNVTGTEERPVYQGIDTSFLVATLTAAIQEQQAIIEQLTNRITALEAK